MKGWESNNTFYMKYRHNWILTTAHDFRWCNHSGCIAAERFVNGKLVSVAQKVMKEEKKKNINCSVVSLF